MIYFWPEILRSKEQGSAEGWFLAALMHLPLAPHLTRLRLAPYENFRVIRAQKKNGDPGIKISSARPCGGEG